jgi:hypothetical protein
MLYLFLMLQTAGNSQLGYRLTVPEDFIRITELIPLPGRDIVDCWGGEASGGSNLILCVERMHAELSPQHLRQADLAPAQQLTSMKWKDYDIDAIRTDTMLGSVAAVIYTARVPLRREAVRVLVTARKDRSDEAYQILTQVVGSLEGESNWTKAAGRSGPVGKSMPWLIAIAVVVVLLRIITTRRKTDSAS